MLGIYKYVPETNHVSSVVLQLFCIYSLRYTYVISPLKYVLHFYISGRWFDPSWCNWNFHLYKMLLIALWPWGRLSL